MEVLTKVCTKCGEEKTLDCFFKQKTGKYGVRTTCKKCDNAYREANKDKIKAFREAYYKSNKDKLNAWQKAYSKDCITNLTDSYISGCIGLTLSECPKELIEVKRLQLQIHRKLKEAK